MTLYRFLSDIEEIIIIVVLIIGIIRYKNLSKELHYVLYFVGLGAITELFLDFYKPYLFKNTMPVGHVYIPLSIIIIGFFYIRILSGFINTKLIRLLLFAYIGFAFVNPFFIQSIWQFPNIIGASGAIMLVIFSILFFSKILTEAKVQKLKKEPLIWLNSIFLFYYSGSFFYYILYNISVNYSNEFARFIVLLNLILVILLYVMIAFVFLMKGKHLPNQ